MNYIFIGTNPILVKYWRLYYDQLTTLFNQYKLKVQNDTFNFHNCSLSQFVLDNNLSTKSTIITPTNSLSYMSGGFDKYILEELLPSTYTFQQLESIIQNHQLSKNQGYLIPNHVYKIDLLELLDEDYKTTTIYKNLNLVELCQIPTMIIPESITPRSIFDSLWNFLNRNSEVGNIIIPGIGTGYGQVSESDCSKIMIFALLIYNLNIPHLQKSLLILFFFNKDYKKFDNKNHLAQLESCLTPYGQQYCFKDGLMDFDVLFNCIKF